MGHFCGIYGLGAIIIIIFSKYISKNNITLFFCGCIIGSITEYLISFFVEVFLGTKWWDYSNNILNINGRICLLYSIFWGILTIFLVKSINPFIEKIIEKVKRKVSSKLIKKVLTFLLIFLLLDCISTCFAQDIFITRIAINNNIEIKNMQKRKENYKKIEESKILNTFINKYWNDKKMIKTFPNIKIEDIEGNIIYLDSLLPNVQPYYLAIF